MLCGPLQFLQTEALPGLGQSPPSRHDVLSLEENHVLKEWLGGRRLRLTDDQRRRLAALDASLAFRT